MTVTKRHLAARKDICVQSISKFRFAIPPAHCHYNQVSLYFKENLMQLFSESQSQLIRDYHVIMEHCFMQPLKNGKWINNAACNLEAIRQLGAESTILSTDCGNPATPPWGEAMGQYLQFMVDHNIDPEELRSMTQITPAHLLGLTDGAK